MTSLGYIFTLIEKERERQELLAASGRFKHTLRDRDLSEPCKVAVIMEEIGEVSRNVLSRQELVTDGSIGDDSLMLELVQIAALSVAWIERLVEDQEMSLTNAEHFRHN